MAIAQLPKRKAAPSKEDVAAAKFIEGAATNPAPEQADPDHDPLRCWTSGAGG